MSVQCLINRTSYAVIWELMPLTSNDDWLSYLHNASQWQWPLILLISVHQKPLLNIKDVEGTDDEDVDEVNIEAVGTA